MRTQSAIALRGRAAAKTATSRVTLNILVVMRMLHVRVIVTQRRSPADEGPACNRGMTNVTTNY